MTTIKTAKQIKDEYLMSSVDSEQPQYVSLQEYEALRQSAGVMSQEAENEALEQQRLKELQAVQNLYNKALEKITFYIDFVQSAKETARENQALRAILQQWAEMAPGLVLFTSAHLEPTELKQLNELIAATKAAVGE